jgi:membrane protein
MWPLRGRQWLALARGVGHQIAEDDILGRAAELAYFFLLSVFPLLLFLTTLLGYLAQGELSGELFGYVSTLSPSHDVTALLRGTLLEITLERSGWKLWLGLAVALLAASNAVLAVGRVLNRAYRYRERRPWLGRMAVAVLVTAVFTLLSTAVLAVFFFGEHLAVLIANALGMDIVFGAVWTVVQGLAMVVLAALGFDLVYNFAPAAAPADRVWLTPGAVFGVAIWLGASLGLRLYLTYFGYYSRIYGSLGAVILLLLWFYLTGAAILIGGEVNSEIAGGAAASGNAPDGERVQ